MVCYILDGYNIINQIKQFSGKTLACKRELLIKFLIDKKPQGTYKNKVIVVFDGKPEVFYSFQELKNYNIEIIFSSGMTADEKIKQIIERSSKPKDYIVVTDDKEIRYYVRYCGAKVLSVGEFIKIQDESKSTRQYSQKFDISEAELRKINEELMKKYKI